MCFWCEISRLVLNRGKRGEKEKRDFNKRRIIVSTRLGANVIFSNGTHTQIAFFNFAEPGFK